jgi:dienelactone hydrolase
MKREIHRSDDPTGSFVALLRALDARDWDAVLARLAPEVHTDYQNLFGSPPETVPADALVAQWREMLTPLDATQHLLGAADVAVDGDSAVLRAPVRGYHFAHEVAGGEQWIVAGQYEARLRRLSGDWQLTHLRLDTHYQFGNASLLERAADRAHPVPTGEGFRCEAARFTSMGERVAGHLYLPIDRTGPVPGVVVLGSWTTVKEQMAGQYASELARRGFAALAFDPRGHGESEGWPRDVESPEHKIEDVKSAAAFLCQHPDVSPARVGALGICAGAGYVAGAAADNAQISALALVAPWLHDAERVREIYGGEEGVERRMEAARQARERFERTGEVEYVPAVSTTDDRAAMFGPFDYYLDADRGAIDAWPNRFAVMAWAGWLEFDPHPFAEHITQPTLMIHSDDAALPAGARSFFRRLHEPKRQHWMSGTQFEFYDRPSTVSEATRNVARHFREYLG